MELFADTSDLNVGDTHLYQWSIDEPSIVLGTTDRQRIETSKLPVGLYRVSVSVSDSALATRSRSLYFKVVDQAVALESAVDSDNDGIDDLTEGASDSDGDGIPNYLSDDDTFVAGKRHQRKALDGRG